MAQCARMEVVRLGTVLYEAEQRALLNPVLG